MANTGYYHTLVQSLPEGIQLVAVSKTYPPEAIMQLYQLGQRSFGENRVQELLTKRSLLPDDIHWHLIGHLQTNKVKQVAPFVHLIHGVDSMRLAREINKEAARCQRTIPILLQVHIALEETKFGFAPAELMNALPELSALPDVELWGLMGMATFTEDTQRVRTEFRSLKTLFDTIGNTYGEKLPSFRHLSMGMSSDYPVAIEEGATIVRVGSLLFGKREYNTAG